MPSASSSNKIKCTHILLLPSYLYTVFMFTILSLIRRRSVTDNFLIKKFSDSFGPRMIQEAIIVYTVLFQNSI